MHPAAINTYTVEKEALQELFTQYASQYTGKSETTWEAIQRVSAPVHFEQMSNMCKLAEIMPSCMTGRDVGRLFLSATTLLTADKLPAATPNAASKMRYSNFLEFLGLLAMMVHAGSNSRLTAKCKLDGLLDMLSGKVHAFKYTAPPLQLGGRRASLSGESKAPGGGGKGGKGGKAGAKRVGNGPSGDKKQAAPGGSSLSTEDQRAKDQRSRVHDMILQTPKGSSAPPGAPKRS